MNNVQSNKTIKLNFETVDSCAVFDHSDHGEITVQIEDWIIENNGIGSYEFHGAPGFDRGQDYVVVQEISVVEVNGEDFDEKLHSEIEKDVQKLWEDGTLDADVEQLPEKNESDYEPEIDDDIA